jgi:hypothetical protein
MDSAKQLCFFDMNVLCVDSNFEARGTIASSLPSGEKATALIQYE